MKGRIWELDAFRGLCILGMVIIHFVYDIVSLYQLVSWQLPDTFLFVQQWGGVLFLLLSGVCATLGRRSVRRGVIVFSCGILVSIVTWVMHRFFGFHVSLVIYFGVLHCLGMCMILWPCVRRLSWWWLVILGAVLIGLGFYVEGIRVSFPWLIGLGLRPAGFATSDYFPMLPNLGFFLLGAAMGKTLYRKQQSLLSGVRANRPIVRFLTGCGKHSLAIYLLHQPVLSGIFYLITLFR